MLKVVVSLQAQPEAFRGSERSRQTLCRISGNPSLSKHDFVDPSRRNLYGSSKPILTDPHGLEKLFQKNLSGVDIGQTIGSHLEFRQLTLLVIVHDFNLSSRIVLPFEANAPLVIDSDAVLTSTVPFQSFQPVARRNPQTIVQTISVRLSPARDC